MRELRPAVRSSAARLVFAVVMPILVLVPLVALGRALLGSSPARYSVADGALVVESGDVFAGTRTVRLADVTEARVVSLQGGRRTAGTAMPGFCAGRFSYPELGAVWQVTTCTGRGVLVRASTESVPLVISPPDAEGFLAALHQGTPATVVLPPPDTTGLRLVTLGMLPLMLIGMLGMSVVLLAGPGRLRYLVGDGALEVHTILGKKRWKTAGARAKAYRPARIWRVAGIGVPGYRTGRYREAGQPTLIYATDMETVLLFEGEERVMLSPEDRVEMLRALEAEGVTIERQVP